MHYCENVLRTSCYLYFQLRDLANRGHSTTGKDFSVLVGEREEVRGREPTFTERLPGTELGGLKIIT